MKKILFSIFIVGLLCSFTGDPIPSIFKSFKYYFGGNWTLTGAKNQWGNGMSFGSKSTAQLAAFNGSSDSLLLQVDRSAERLTFQYGAGAGFKPVAWLSDVTSGTAANADSLGHLPADQYQHASQYQGTNGIEITVTSLPAPTYANTVWKLNNTNAIALTGTGEITSTAAIQGTNLTATGHVATVGLTVTGGAQISAPLTVTGALSFPGTSSQVVLGNGSFASIAALAASPFTGTSNITTTVSGATLSVTGNVWFTGMTVSGGITAKKITIPASEQDAVWDVSGTVYSNGIESGHTNAAGADLYAGIFYNNNIGGNGVRINAGATRGKPALFVSDYLNSDSVINASLAGIYLYKPVTITGAVTATSLSSTLLVTANNTSTDYTIPFINSTGTGQKTFFNSLGGATINPNTGNLTATTFTGQIITAVQTNITTLGTLVNLTTSGSVTATGRITGSTLSVSGQSFMHALTISGGSEILKFVDAGSNSQFFSFNGNTSTTSPRIGRESAAGNSMLNSSGANTLSLGFNAGDHSAINFGPNGTVTSIINEAGISTTGQVTAASITISGYALLGGAAFINSSSALVVGTTTDDIRSRFNSNTFYPISVRNGTNNVFYFGANTSGDGIFSNNAGTNIGRIDQSTGAYTATSDRNKKKDFELYNGDGIKNILLLRPTLYRMKWEGKFTPKHLWFIAQDVKKIIPQAYIEDKSGFIGIDEKPIIANLVMAVQQQQKQIEVQNKEIVELKSLVQKLIKK